MESTKVCRGGDPFTHVKYVDNAFSSLGGRAHALSFEVMPFQGLVIKKSLMTRTSHLFTLSTLFPLSTSLIYSRDVNSSSNRTGSLLLNLSFRGQLCTIVESGYTSTLSLAPLPAAGLAQS